VAGAVGGVVIALPARRLHGIYYGLLTFGLVELCRALVLQTADLGQVVGLYGADSFNSPAQQGTLRGAVVSHYAAVVLLAVVLLVYRGISNGRLGLLLRTSKEAQFAYALGVDVARARLLVFVLSSSVLGLVGSFYAANYRGVSPSIFSFDLLLLLFAMVVIGGVGSAKGALLGTAALVVLDHHFATEGAMRYVAIGLLLFAVTTFANGGFVGLAGRVRERFLLDDAGRPVAEVAVPDHHAVNAHD
jgi:branched-chain amino acid transport system permease protein